MPVSEDKAKELSYADRMIDFLFFLDVKRETHYKEIEDRYQISESAVKRMMNKAKDTYDVPFYNMSGRYGSVRVDDKWRFIIFHPTAREKSELRKIHDEALESGNTYRADFMTTFMSCFF